MNYVAIELPIGVAEPTHMIDKCFLKARGIFCRFE